MKTPCISSFNLTSKTWGSVHVCRRAFNWLVVAVFCKAKTVCVPVAVFFYNFLPFVCVLFSINKKGYETRFKKYCIGVKKSAGLISLTSLFKNL